MSAPEQVATPTPPAAPGTAKPRRRRLASWWEHHRWSAFTSLARLVSRPLGSLLTIAVMGLALALPLAFYLLLLWADSGAKRYYAAVWVAFLLGFGALEVNVVFPALAGVYLLLYARKRLLAHPPSDRHPVPRQPSLDTLRTLGGSFLIALCAPSTPGALWGAGPRSQ